MEVNGEIYILEVDIKANREKKSNRFRPHLIDCTIAKLSSFQPKRVCQGATRIHYIKTPVSFYCTIRMQQQVFLISITR